MFERPGRPADAWPGAPSRTSRPPCAAKRSGLTPPDFSCWRRRATTSAGSRWFVFDIFTQYQEGGPWTTSPPC